ncbi:MAG: hypothetical protein KAI72_02990 [Candidatus Pacebacteria bacterium]|nr:hypothetical protein [Candidatus Paceibacterota bacterium]
MKEIPLSKVKLLLSYCVCFFLLLTVSVNAYALYMVKVPKEAQTKAEEPVERKIQLKLPLEQPLFHWMFISKKDLLSGKLVLKIKRNESIDEIIIFNNGEFNDGWEAISFDLPEKAMGEIYFGFISTKKYLTAPGDKIEIELTIVEDLEGIGRLQTGVLKASVYKSKGKFLILDELKLKKQGVANNTAYFDNWETQWSLEITKEKGWLPPQEAAELKEANKLLTDMQSGENANFLGTNKIVNALEQKKPSVQEAEQITKNKGKNIFAKDELSQLVEDVKHIINADVFKVLYSEVLPPNGASLVMLTSKHTDMFSLITELQKSSLIKKVETVYSKGIEAGTKFEINFYFTEQAKNNDVKTKELNRLKEKLLKIF